MPAPASSALPQALLAEMPLTANVLLSHTHWDHIQGLPFFVPNFVPGNTLRLHGAFDPVSGKGVEQVMAVQLQYSYFPVREAELKARIEYVTLMPETPVQIGSATSHALPAQPPGDQLWVTASRPTASRCSSPATTNPHGTSMNPAMPTIRRVPDASSTKGHGHPARHAGR
jgi:hypothetical protein